MRFLVAIVCAVSFLAESVRSAEVSEPSVARSYTERMTAETQDGMHAAEQYVIGKGHGDMNKGEAVCRRVAELSARTNLAKQIRVLVKEHMVDRVRERSGRELEQDIELTREEIVQEYLQGVKIVDYRIDEAQKICLVTAIMPKK